MLLSEPIERCIHLAWCGDRPAACARGFSQPLVVGDYLFDRRTELPGAGEVDGVERPEVSRLNQSGVVENSVVDAQELNPPEHIPTSSHGVAAPGHKAPRNLRARQCAAYEWLATRDPQRSS